MMSRDKLVTLALISAATIATGLHWVVLETDVLRPAPVGLPSAMDRQEAPAIEAKVAPAPDLSEILARPLFFEGRRMPTPEVAASPVAAAEIPQPEPLAAAAPPPEFHLYGVRSFEGRMSVLLAADAQSEPVWLEKGATVQGWELSEITDNTALLRRGTQQQQLRVYADAD